MYIKRRNSEDNLYKQLQDSSLQMIQELSGNVWTDFNPHDPGITILDHLHYALLELQHICEFNFQDYLKNANDDTKVDYGKAGLFAAEELFIPSVVTHTDYENLIKSNLDEVNECKIDLDKNGLYRIVAEVKKDVDHERLSMAIEALYHANRNLCENLGKIEFKEIKHFKNETDKITDSLAFSADKDLAITYSTSPEYSSIQYDFPDCYGINDRGMRPGMPDEYKAKVLQLKAYLLIFDYLMGQTVLQINDIAQLLTFSAKIPEDKIPDIQIPDIDALIDSQRIKKSTLRDETFLHEQKQNYLNVLDTIYGENTREICQADNVAESNQKRIRLIPKLLQYNANRFRSFNIQNYDPNEMPVIKRIISAMLDYDIQSELPATTILARYNLHLISDEHFFDNYEELILNVDFDLENNNYHNNIETIPAIEIVFNEYKYEHFKKHLSFFWHDIIFETLLQYGSNPEYYRIVQQQEINGYLVLFRYDKLSKWINMGFFFEKELLIQTVNELWAFLKMLNQQSCSFYLIEHILLRGQKDDDIQDRNTLSIVIPEWAERFHDRAQYEQMIIERLPAHLTLQTLWLNAHELDQFEQLYFPWRKALSEKNEENIFRLSDAIKKIITRNIE